MLIVWHIFSSTISQGTAGKKSENFLLEKSRFHLKKGTLADSVSEALSHTQQKLRYRTSYTNYFSPNFLAWFLPQHMQPNNWYRHRYAVDPIVLHRVMSDLFTVKTSSFSRDVIWQTTIWNLGRKEVNKFSENHTNGWQNLRARKKEQSHC